MDGYKSFARDLRHKEPSMVLRLKHGTEREWEQKAFVNSNETGNFPK